MIKVSYLLSYDYHFFLTSVKQLYEYTNKIVVAVDINRMTWSGNKFVIPDSFFEEVKSFDTKNIIEFYYDDFYMPSLSPMECETRERNLVLKKLGHGWKIQLDVDEYIYDFKKVNQYLKKNYWLTIFPKLTPICLKGKLITLFREVPEGYLYIDNNETFPFITNQSINTNTRNNNVIRNFYTNISVIHQSWARSEEEINFKIKNWGHRDDFDTIHYFELWKNVNVKNYSFINNFHPLSPEVWNKLYFTKSIGIDNFIKNYSNENKQEILNLPVKKIIKTAIKKIIGRE